MLVLHLLSCRYGLYCKRPKKPLPRLYCPNNPPSSAPIRPEKLIVSTTAWSPVWCDESVHGCVTAQEIAESRLNNAEHSFRELTELQDASCSKCGSSQLTRTVLLRKLKGGKFKSNEILNWKQNSNWNSFDFVVLLYFVEMVLVVFFQFDRMNFYNQGHTHSA